MLDPGRKGPGLFGGGSPPRGADPQHLSPPKINVGPGFQAAVPATAGGGCTRDPPAGATLAWSPWPGLEGDPEMQQRVETLLDLACSSALPGGGTNRELALHCLARARGSLTGALEMLLLGTPGWPHADPLAGYHYTGSDAWTPRERRLFAQALARHGKDFVRIQHEVPSKRTTQCVEFYYLHKARLGRARRQAPPESLGSCFPCKLCGKTFPKIKSRNAHMKIHRQQEGWGGAPLLPPPWPPGAPTGGHGGGHGRGAPPQPS
ncbi:zinc finger protein 541-like [Chlamydotis macqueenii]